MAWRSQTPAVEPTELTGNAFNTGEDFDTDIKIRPDFYIHNLILKAQQALIKDNVQDGFLQYVVLISQLEGLCHAAKRLPKNYYDSVEEFKRGLPKDARDITSRMQLADFKFQLIMGEVFDNQTVTEPMKL